MDASAFDAGNFLQTTLTKKGSTQYIVPDEGWYNAMIQPQDLTDPRISTSDKGTFVIWGLMFTLDDSSGKIKEKTGFDENKVEHALFLDLNDQGELDLREGKNIPLNRVREALGQNTDAAWAPSMVASKSCQVHVRHRINQEDGSTRARVVAVAPPNTHAVAA